MDGPDGFSTDSVIFNEGGFDAYLVGGCVRDLILKRTPKDFDVLTTAELKEVTKAFSWCEIVGKRFPICHVHVGDDVVEVSSFSTSARNYSMDPGLTFQQHDGFDEKDHNRWRNSRILRAIRIAARLRFGFSRETSHAIKHLAHSVLLLDKGRHLMEINYMLAYGSAEPSLRQHILFVMVLGDEIRRLICFWVAILAFHMAVLDRPRGPLVVAAFSLAVHNGGDMEEAISIARKLSKPHATTYHELSEPKSLEQKALKKEVLELGSSVLISLHLYLKAVKIFECVNQGKEARFVQKQGSKINYEMLAMGSVQEVRHMFARIVFDTVYPLDLGQR
ncbi:hypothetical protein L1987_66902 [Smallanthus sonchifolius]|uniref:Uncharacterized protein n=1 Tax=Smallanthus sonchifolius TaxID=185202 RepID=A0ACB9BYK3_9ASTR|nr:hypothetical protein L1987_66902 [Smallanthus sonchifolius]